MSIWVDCDPTPAQMEECIRRDITHAKTLEEWCQIARNTWLSQCENTSEVLDLWTERGNTIKRDLISNIETPEDGFALHLRLKSIGSYSKVIQEELADKIRDVVANWCPPVPGGFTTF